MDHDDVLPVHALYRVAEELNAYPAADLVYSDEDMIDETGRRYNPHFKPDWNPDLLYSQNWVSHLGVYRSSLVKAIGGFREGYEGSQDYDLLLRFIEHTSVDRIRHIPEVLYHWRSIPGSVALGAQEKPYAHAAARRAIQSHFDRSGVMAKIQRGFRQLHRVSYARKYPEPRVSLVIGTRDRADLLATIVSGVLYETDYSNLELIIVDNGSEESVTLRFLEKLQRDRRVRVIRHEAAFNFAEINNLGVSSATGELIGLINSGLEVISPDWLDEMVSHALRPEIGVVGVRLLYKNNTVQHAGLILGLGGCVAGHVHKGLTRRAGGYLARAHLIQDFSAVTGACMLFRRDVFDLVNGLEGTRLAFRYSDVDFCLKVRERGFRVVYVPTVELYYHESLSRGMDATPDKAECLQRESDYMRERWGDLLLNDPYYNPNLSLESESWSLAFPPRVARPWKST